MRSPIYSFTPDKKWCYVLNSENEETSFRVMKQSVTLPNFVPYVDLFEAYDNPSNDKCYYFRFWQTFFSDLPQTRFWGVRSHNTYQFTLHGTIRIKHALYYFIITAKNQYLYPVKA